MSWTANPDRKTPIEAIANTRVKKNVIDGRRFENIKPVGSRGFYKNKNKNQKN
jgi:hypothetical protein